MDKAILLPFIIWFFLTIALAVRRGIKLYARLFIIATLAAYCFMWKDELLVLINYSQLDYINIIIESVKYAHASLVWIWPLSLIFALYSASDKESTIMITILSIFTLFIWLLYVIFR